MRRPKPCPHCGKPDRLDRVHTRPEGVLWFCDRCQAYCHVEVILLMGAVERLHRDMGWKEK